MLAKKLLLKTKSAFATKEQEPAATAGNQQFVAEREEFVSEM